MKELLKIILTCRIRTHVRSHEQPLTLPACSITSCNPDAMWLPSVMPSLGYKSFLSKSRHTAVCTMHLRPWCLKTSSSVRQGHWGVHKCHHSQTCQGRELTSQPGLTLWKQCSDIASNCRYSLDTDTFECTGWPLLPAPGWDVAYIAPEVAEERLLLCCHTWDLFEHKAWSFNLFLILGLLVYHGWVMSLGLQFFVSFKQRTLFKLQIPVLL